MYGRRAKKLIKATSYNINYKAASASRSATTGLYTQNKLPAQQTGNLAALALEHLNTVLSD